MKAFITGGTGFVGTYLTDRLLKSGWNVSITGRSGQSIHKDNSNLSIIACDTKEPGDWQQSVADADLIINLAGKNIFTLWRDKTKKEIKESRILTTRNIVEAIPKNSPVIFISTSAGGYYGDRKDMVLKEDACAGEGFLAELCQCWEYEALQAEKKGVRTVIMRFGMVLGQGGGALKMMVPSFRMFLGGSLGKGDNWVPWIHIDDLVSAILYSVETKGIKGPLNFCTPYPVSHRTLIKAVAKALGRPAFFRLPSFLIKVVMGGLGKEILFSQRMTPESLIVSGFNFKFENIDYALMDLLDTRD